MFLELDQILQDEFDLDGPRWNQKQYVAYQVNNYNWLCVHTKSKLLVLDLHVKSGSFKTADLAERLKVEQYDSDDSLSDKLNMPSSLFVKNRNVTSDRIRLRAKEDFDVKSSELISFLKDAYKASPK
ncbi:hypothetical protein M1M87_00240 [Thermodesulfovibrionales bacterium]|nr:hypothetical protein [Thermodesulfovibrionales bacterium]